MQCLSQRREGLVSHIKHPSLWDLHQRDKFPKIFGLENQWGLCPKCYRKLTLVLQRVLIQSHSQKEPEQKHEFEKHLDCEKSICWSWGRRKLGLSLNMEALEDTICTHKLHIPACPGGYAGMRPLPLPHLDTKEQAVPELSPCLVEATESRQSQRSPTPWLGLTQTVSHIILLP